MAEEPQEAREADEDPGSEDGGSTSGRLRELGGYIREQRNRAEYSLRHLSRLAGVSNPYLSQIERGLRKPSAEILQAIAKALHISSETLYVKAGILEERRDIPDLEVAIQRDEHLNERQRAAMVEIYRSFRRENARRGDARPETPIPETSVTDVSGDLGPEDDVDAADANAGG